MASPNVAQGPAPALAVAPVYATEAARLAAEKEQKDKALQEKLDKRAAIVAGVLRKFVTNFYAGRLQELSIARAAEAAKKAAKGKKGGTKKKAAPEPKGGDKGGKPKKAPPTPIQQAWITFLADMDDRINKQKRIFLEDMYRGVAALDPHDQSLLSAALATTTNKILPLDGMNINQLNVKEAVAAGCAACALARASALPPSGNPGLTALKDRGASVTQLIEFGFKPGDALRAGYPCHAVVHASQHQLHELRVAGVTPCELLSCPEAPELATDLTQGLRGVTRLKQAGFSASELVSGGLDNAWTLATAGYKMQELQGAGVSSVEHLRSAGFGDKDRQPVAFRAGAMQGALNSAGIGCLPQRLTGTQDPAWQSLLAASTTPPGAQDVRASSISVAGAGGRRRGP